jgi:hypothetical protein
VGLHPSDAECGDAPVSRETARRSDQVTAPYLPESDGNGDGEPPVASRRPPRTATTLPGSLRAATRLRAAGMSAVAGPCSGAPRPGRAGRRPHAATAPLARVTPSVPRWPRPTWERGPAWERVGLELPAGSADWDRYRRVHGRSPDPVTSCRHPRRSDLAWIAAAVERAHPRPRRPPRPRAPRPSLARQRLVTAEPRVPRPAPARRTGGRSYPASRAEARSRASVSARRRTPIRSRGGAGRLGHRAADDEALSRPARAGDAGSQRCTPRPSTRRTLRPPGGVGSGWLGTRQSSRWSSRPVR